MRFKSVTMVILAAGLLAAATDANAARADRLRYQTASKDCQGALPAFAGTLRARPLALGNEGDVTAFVTCGFQGDTGYRHERTHQIFVRVGMTRAGSATISCTMVVGFGGGTSSAVYLPQTVTLSQGESTTLFWNEGEAGPGTDLEMAQVSCSLPPGAVIYQTYTVGSEEIGS